MSDRIDPYVWPMFERFTLDLIRRGFEHYSADAVMHRVRWETAVAQMDGGGFKINNDDIAYYAREFHRRYPAFDGFFRTRRSMADQQEAA